MKIKETKKNIILAGQIAVEESTRLKVLLVEPGETPADDQVEGARIPPVMAKLAEGEGPERKQRRTTGQRLTDRLVQQGLMAAGQDEAAGLTGLVDDSLQVGKQAGQALHLVQDRTSPRLPEEAARVGLGSKAKVGILQREVGLLREGHPDERGLPRLPRSENRDHGILGSGLPQLGGDLTNDHVGRITMVCEYFKYKF